MTHQLFLRTEKRRKSIIIFTQIALLLLLLVLWEVCTMAKILDPFIFSSPTRVYNQFVIYVKNGSIFYHTLISVQETTLGLVIGTSLGIIIAIGLYMSKFLAKVFDPFLVVLNALPKTALAPIFIILVGTNIQGIVFTAVSISLILTIISACTYFNSTDLEMVKMMKCFKANRRQILSMLIIPSNRKNLLSIVKINIGMSWIGVIVAEYIVSRAGIGYLITYGSSVFNFDLIMMGVVTLAIVTMLMYGLLSLIEYLLCKFKGW